MGSSFSCSCSGPTVLVLPGGHYFSFTAQYTFVLQKSPIQWSYSYRTFCSDFQPCQHKALYGTWSCIHTKLLNPALQEEAPVRGPWAGSPACVEVHPLPGTKQTTPQGCIFTACWTGCVYSNVLNWISVCEANLLIVFLMTPWAAQGADLRPLRRDAFWGKLKGQMCSRSARSAPQLPAGFQPMGPA